MSVVDRNIELLGNPKVIEWLAEAVELYKRLEKGEIKIVEVSSK